MNDRQHDEQPGIRPPSRMRACIAWRTEASVRRAGRRPAQERLFFVFFPPPFLLTVICHYFFRIPFHSLDNP